MLPQRFLQNNRCASRNLGAGIGAEALEFKLLQCFWTMAVKQNTFLALSFSRPSHRAVEIPEIDLPHLTHLWHHPKAFLPILMVPNSPHSLHFNTPNSSLEGFSSPRENKEREPKAKGKHSKRKWLVKFECLLPVINCVNLSGFRTT